MTDKLIISNESTHHSELVVNKHYVQIFTLRNVALRQWGASFFELNREPTPRELLDERESIEEDGSRAVFLKLTHYDADSMSWFDYASESITTITFNGDNVADVITPRKLN